MATLSFTEAFGAFGATLVNANWAYSAIAADGSLVMSCWSHKLTLTNGVLVYKDNISRWNAKTAGKPLLKKHLQTAHDEALPVRLVIATTSRPDLVDAGGDGSTIEKTFHIKEEVVGRVTHFDGDNFIIEYRRG